MTVWLCGRSARCSRDKTPLAPREPSWGVVGLFTDRAAAEAACADCRFWIVEIPIDQPLTGEPSEQIWPNCKHAAGG